MSMMVGVVDGLALHGGRDRHTLSCRDAERYRCACLHCTQGLAGRGDGYQFGLQWGRSRITICMYCSGGKCACYGPTGYYSLCFPLLPLSLYLCCGVSLFFLSLMPAVVAE